MFLTYIVFSGAGKTSLLSALSYSTKSPQRASGTIYVNGCPANCELMSKVSKYVQQNDLFFVNMSVREHLMFHARLRVESHTTEEEVKTSVENMITKFSLPSDDRNFKFLRNILTFIFMFILNY